MDIRKLQRAIVDGLEDVKGQAIMVFDTEHLSPLFERVVIASGLSNRQTKALAASVRDSVKSQGFPVLRTEGEDNGEWIIVDCGAAVVHLMQPAIRDYYHLEEIWGDKQVKLNIAAAPKKLVKASEEPAPAKKKPAAKKTAAKAMPARTAAKKPAARGEAARPGAKKVVAKKAAKKAATGVTRTTGVKKTASSAVAKKPAAGTPSRKTSAKKTPARKTSGR
jgi:ribosome-associated protein